MDWKHWLWQALMVFVVVVVVLAMLRVLDVRFRLNPTEALARPFFPPAPGNGGGAGDGSSSLMA